MPFGTTYGHTFAAAPPVLFHAVALLKRLFLNWYVRLSGRTSFQPRIWAYVTPPAVTTGAGLRSLQTSLTYSKLSGAEASTQRATFDFHESLVAPPRLMFAPRPPMQ